MIDESTLSPLSLSLFLSLTLSLPLSLSLPPSLSLSPSLSLRERVVIEYERTGELLINLASDQTSLHNPFGGGYYPVQLSYNEAQKVMASEPLRFKELVQERCICMQVSSLGSLSSIFSQLCFGSIRGFYVD